MPGNVVYGDVWFLFYSWQAQVRRAEVKRCMLWFGNASFLFFQGEVKQVSVPHGSVWHCEVFIFSL